MLKLVSFKEYCETGSSQCFLGSCNNNKDWIIRLKKKDYNSKRLISQYIASNLAKLIGISCPHSKLIEINFDLLNSLPRNYSEFDSDCNIGVSTIFINDLKIFPPPPNYPKCLSSQDFGKINTKHLNEVILLEQEHSQLYGMKVFSDWVQLNDYHKYENLCLDSNNKLIFLDFDIAFSTSNGSFALPNEYDWIAMMSHQAPFWEGIIENNDFYEPWFNKILSITSEDFQHIISNIPKCWGIPDQYPDLLMNFLLSNRNIFILEFILAYEYRNNEKNVYQ